MRSSLLSSNNNKREREREEERFLFLSFCCVLAVFNTARGVSFFFSNVFFLFSAISLHIFSSLRWISTVPITRAFIGASLLSTHCLADTQREIFSRFSNNIIIEYNKNERDGQIVVERGGDHHY